jgi:hypothetical protein
MTLPFFFIIAHIEIYFIIHIAFLNVVHYKTLNIRLDLYLLVINPKKPTRGPKCTFRRPMLSRKGARNLLRSPQPWLLGRKPELLSVLAIVLMFYHEEPIYSIFISFSYVFSERPGCPCVVVWTWMYAVAFVVPRLTLLCTAWMCSFGTLLVLVCDAVRHCGGEVMI